MELTTLINDRTRGIVRDIAADLGNGEILHARVRPAGLSTTTQRDMMRISRMTDAAGQTDDPEVIDLMLGALPRALAELVVSWDLTLGGEPVPPTVAGVEGLGIDVLQLLFAAVQEAMTALPKGMPA